MTIVKAPAAVGDLVAVGRIGTGFVLGRCTVARAGEVRRVRLASGESRLVDSWPWDGRLVFVDAAHRVGDVNAVLRSDGADQVFQSQQDVIDFLLPFRTDLPVSGGGE